MPRATLTLRCLFLTVVTVVTGIFFLLQPPVLVENIMLRA